MKTNKDDKSPLFSETILSTDDLFEEEDDLNSNGLDIDPNEVVLQKPVEQKEELPLEETMVFEEAPLDEPVENIIEDDLFQTEPVETPISSGKTKKQQVKKPVEPVTKNQAFFEEPPTVNVNSKEYEDEPKKSFRKPIILIVMGLVIIGCLVWFLVSVFGNQSETQKADTSTNSTEEIIVEPDKELNTPNGSHNNNNNNHNSNNGNNSYEYEYNPNRPGSTNTPSDNYYDDDYDSYPDKDEEYIEPSYPDDSTNDYVEEPSEPPSDDLYSENSGTDPDPTVESYTDTSQIEESSEEIENSSKDTLSETLPIDNAIGDAVSLTE